MVTQATAEQTQGKRRPGRPSKKAAVELPPKKEGDKGTDFQRLVKEYRSDTIVKAFVNLRLKLFKEGEETDNMTESIKKRIADLQKKKALH